MLLPFFRRYPRLLVLSWLALITAVGSVRAQDVDIAAPSDVLRVTVVDQPTLSGKYTVDGDGGFVFPLVGRVRAGGLPVKTVETELTTRLAGGYLKNPRLSIAIERAPRPSAAFVVGEVRQAGSYPLTPNMTLIELLASAGWTTDKAADVVIVTRRQREALPERPAEKPEPLTPEVVRFNLKELHAGTASGAGILIGDGDTVFVPRAASVYVLGEVRSPGTFALQEDLTVLQALALAGGLTERGSLKRVRIVRASDAEKKPVKVNRNTRVEAGDTIMVGESLF